ncbi:tetratricopeptide repeat protein [Aestuariivirga litoralis]|uniref:tetratricopeptide repeat protein n=1 Tax=Aestuariivirga litoralis TaxID=2650924 RepID=UPI0018C7582A|nr:tetratricopeptide repeat protein [Aestuariivirga litoralis]MBG1233063.1 tetratricopeptide repeat protein [Aestuariivirga litoralis]
MSALVFSLARYQYARRLLAGLIVLVVGLIIGSLWGPRDALASPPTGECKTMYLKWQKQGGYGSFAWSQRGGRCGYNNNALHQDDSRASALKACARNDCVIIQTLNSPSEWVSNIKTCFDGNEGAIEACGWLINNRKEKGRDLGSDYNMLGVIYAKQGNAALARQYYDLAIKAYPKQAWAISNIGRQMYDRGDYQGALDYLKKAVALFKDPGHCQAPDCDFRARNQEMIEQISGELERIKTANSFALCISATSSKLDSWNTERIYAAAEAKRRGLTLGDCRVLAGRERAVNTYENYPPRGVCDAGLDDARLAFKGTDSDAAREAHRRNFTLGDCRRLLGLRENPVPEAVTNGATQLLSQIEQFSSGGHEFADPVAIARAVSELKAALADGKTEDVQAKTATLAQLTSVNKTFSSFTVSVEAHKIDLATTELMINRAKLASMSGFAKDYVSHHLTSDKNPQLLGIIDNLEDQAKSSAGPDLAKLVTDTLKTFENAGLQGDVKDAMTPRVKAAEDAAAVLNSDMPDEAVIKSLAAGSDDAPWTAIARQRLESLALHLAPDGRFALEFGPFADRARALEIWDRIQKLYPDTISNIKPFAPGGNAGTGTAMLYFDSDLSGPVAISSCRLMTAVSGQSCKVVDGIQKILVKKQ